MLKICVENSRNKNQHNYEQKFKDKIEQLSSLPNYSKIESIAQYCIDVHCGDGLIPIKARTFIDNVIKTPTTELLESMKVI